jgi:hypothetical protein
MLNAACAPRRRTLRDLYNVPSLHVTDFTGVNQISRVLPLWTASRYLCL